MYAPPIARRRAPGPSPDPASAASWASVSPSKPTVAFAACYAVAALGLFLQALAGRPFLPF